MVFALIQTADALLELEQRFVNLLTVFLSLLLHIHVISPSLVSGQINKIHFSEGLFTIFKCYL